MRLLLYSQVTLAVLAALAIFSADRLAQPGLMYAGALCLGGLMVLAGIDSIITRHVRFFDVNIGSTTYQGLAAQLWGITFVVTGGAIAAFGVFGLTSSSERSLVELLFEQPGIPLIGLAAVLLGGGGATLLGPTKSRASGQSFLLTIPYRLGGLIGIGLGLITLALGVIAVTAPTQLDEAVSLIIQTLSLILG